MSQQKRERQKDARHARLEAERIAAAEQQRRRRMRVGLALFAVVIVALAAVVTLTSDDDEEAEAPDATTSTTDPTTDPTATDPLAAVVGEPPAGETLTGPTACPPESGAEARVDTFAQAPPTCVKPGETLQAVVTTSRGTFTIGLDSVGAPATVNNFVVLARYRFYDGVPFHRLLPGFAAQTGSSGVPTWGGGGPGYDLGEGERPEAPYAIGDVAMARGETVSGSQFFVITGEQGAGLQPDYPRLGKVTDGMDVVTAISERGDPAQTESGTDGVPLERIVVETVTVEPG